MILIIDKDPAVRGYVKQSLVGAGTVMEAANITEAVEKFSSLTFDVVLVDLETVGGLDFLREFKAKMAPARVVIHAPGEDPQQIIESLSGGAGALATQYLIKPADSKTIRDTVMNQEVFGDFVIDSYLGDIFYKGKRLELSSKVMMFTILSTIIRAGRPVSYQDLARVALQKELPIKKATIQLKTYVMLIKQALEPHGLTLKARYGKGFEVVAK